MAAGPILDGQKWCSDQSSFIAEEFDDTYLVYLKASGETHFLNFLSYGLLVSVVDQAHDAKELQTILCARFDLDNVDLSLDLVQKTIEDLDEAGLIVPGNKAIKGLSHE